MLRVHLNTDDVARVRVDASWGPFVEALLSLRVLAGPRSSALMDGWRRSVRDQIPDSASPLLTLVQPISYVDLLTVVGPTSSIDEASEALQRASHEHLRQELEPLSPGLAGTPAWTGPWLRALYDGDRKARTDLAASLREYSSTALDPYWRRIRAHLAEDRAHRVRVLGGGGVEALLATLHPRIRWRSPVLEIQRPPIVRHDLDVDMDVDLGGRSLTLVPSVFCDHPALYSSAVDEAAPAVLVYPGLRDLDEALTIWRVSDDDRRALEALLGRTRAAALEAIADAGATTTDLARRIGVAPATASHHASALRRAGLVTTRRTGSAVLHSVTQRGEALLDNDRPSG